MTLTRRTRFGVRTLGPLVTLAVLLAGLLAGCGGDDEPDTKGGDEPTATASASGDGQDAGDGASAGTQTIEVPETGLSFEIPEGWTSVDAEEALDPDSGILDDLAERMNMSPEQLSQTFASQLSVMAVSDEGMQDGFLTNMNVATIPQADVNASQLKMGLATVGGSVEDTETEDSEAGEVVRITYSITPPQGGASEAHGVMLAVDIGDEVLAVTVTSASADEADELADDIRDSLALES